jgi:pimeloyl-ACP methyl ester carboxylesterase
MDDPPAADGTTIRSGDGTRLRLHRRAPADPDRAREAVLFVHGATYPGRPMFDLPRASWLADCADAGRAAYAVDVRGYGDSEAPPELDVSADEHPPVVRADVAREDVAAALDHVTARHDRVHLVGYSWGSMLCGGLLAERSDGAATLTLLAPVHAVPDGAPSLGGTDAYRVVTEAAVRERWDAHFEAAGVAPDRYRAPGTVEAVWTALLASGQAVDGDGPPAVRAPNGALVDLREAAADGPRYDAGRIDVPTLVVRGSLDTTATRADALGLFDALDVDEREYAEIAGGSHFLPVERRRASLVDRVRGFHARGA